MSDPTRTTFVFADCAFEVEMTPESIGPDGEMSENCRIVRELTAAEIDAIRVTYRPGDRFVNPDGSVKPRSEWPVSE